MVEFNIKNALFGLYLISLYFQQNFSLWLWEKYFSGMCIKHPVTVNILKRSRGSENLNSHLSRVMSGLGNMQKKVVTKKERVIHVLV